VQKEHVQEGEGISILDGRRNIPLYGVAEMKVQEEDGF